MSTGLTVNIAEGNGRFSHLDHGRFLLTAQDAGTKLAAYPDLVQAVSLLHTAVAKSHLRQVMAMLDGLAGYLEGQADGNATRRKNKDKH